VSKKNYDLTALLPVVFHAERHTDRHDEANNRVSQFCERV